MSAGREAHDAHACGVDAILAGMVADVAQGCLRVLERHFPMTVGKSVFERHDRDALGREPLADLVSFALHGYQAVAAARADDDGLPVALSRAAG